MSGTLAERTMSAAKWRLVATVVQGGLQFGIGVFLARILPPADFGVVALALAVIGLAGAVSDLGLEAAVIQRRDLSERHLRTAFTASVLLGLVLSGTLVLLAPLSGALLRAPVLPDVLRALALLFVVGALGGTSRALLRRRLRFRALFWTGSASFLVGYAGVVTTLAFAGFGVWSLVWGSLAQAALEAALVLGLVRPPVRPLLGRAEVRELLGFGAGVSLNNVVNYAARNGDNLVVGRWLGAAALGLYGRAYNLMTLPLTYLGAATHQVLFPAMSEIQHDRERLGRAYLTAVQLSALAAAPVMAGMAVAAPHMVAALYGPAWTGMVLPLQCLCAAGAFRAVYHVAGAVTYAAGRVYAELKRQVVYAALVAAGAVLASRWGIEGVAAAVTLAIVYMYVAMASLALGIVGRSWRDFLAAQAPGLAVGVMVGAAALCVRVGMELEGFGSGATFAAVLAACAASLPAAVYLLPARLRPTALLALLGPAVLRLPRPLQGAMSRVLRLAPAAPVAP